MNILMRLLLMFLSIDHATLGQSERIGVSYVARERIADVAKLSDNEIAKEVEALARSSGRNVAQLRIYERDSPELDSMVHFHLPYNALRVLETRIDPAGWCLADALYVKGEINIRRRCHEANFRETIIGKDPLFVGNNGFTGKIEYTRFGGSAEDPRVDVFVVGPVLPNEEQAAFIFKKFEQLYEDLSVSLWWSVNPWFPDSGRFTIGFPFAKVAFALPTASESRRQPWVRCFEGTNREVVCLRNKTE